MFLVHFQNQFFVSGLAEDEVIQNRVLDSLYNRIMRAHREKRCFRVIIVIPLLPGFQVLSCRINSFHLDLFYHVSQLLFGKQGGVDDGGAATVRAIMHWQYRTICRAESSIFQKLDSELGPLTHNFISFFGLRTHGRLFDGGPLVTSQVYIALAYFKFIILFIVSA